MMLLVVLALAAPVTRATPRAPAPPQAAPMSTPATVDKAEPKERVIYKKRTVLDFTGDLIEGDLIKPEGSYVVSRKASRFSSLIRIRENFLPELISSSNDL